MYRFGMEPEYPWQSYGATEIGGLPQQPGGLRPPQPRPDQDQAAYLRDLISFYTTPQHHQQMTQLDGGMHFGPARDATVRPQDMQQAADMVALLSSLEAERDLAHRRELANKVLEQPHGGGTITMNGKTVAVGGGEPGMSRRDVAALEGGGYAGSGYSRIPADEELAAERAKASAPAGGPRLKPDDAERAGEMMAEAQHLEAVLRNSDGLSEDERADAKLRYDELLSALQLMGVLGAPAAGPPQGGGGGGSARYNPQTGQFE